MSNPTKNSPWTNASGTLAIIMAAGGVVTKWWLPEYFHGTWYEIISVGLTGLVLIHGLGDDFLQRLKNRIFKRKANEMPA